MKTTLPVRFWRALSEFAERKHVDAMLKQRANEQKRGVSLQKDSVITITSRGRK